MWAVRRLWRAGWAGMRKLLMMMVMMVGRGRPERFVCWMWDESWCWWWTLRRFWRVLPFSPRVARGRRRLRSRCCRCCWHRCSSWRRRLLSELSWPCAWPAWLLRALLPWRAFDDSTQRGWQMKRSSELLTRF
ncbi:hypothetical protein IWZ01DRAFT_491272 [Phyllosticta capitalensis]